jgi:sporulation protein YlmC with PRC-barrel domain
MDFVEKVSDDQVILHEPKAALDELNEFEETHYLPLDENGEGLNAYYWNPPLAGLNTGPYPVFPHPVYIVKTTSNIPENYVALKEGARVITEDGEHAGNLERVITDTKTDQATHIVISSGFLLKENKLVPAHWIKDVTEDEVKLSIESGLLDRLVEYEEER